MYGDDCVKISLIGSDGSKRKNYKIKQSCTVYAAALRRLRERSGLATHRLRVVGGDEYAGVPRDDPGSFYQYTLRRVLRPLGCDPRAALLLDGGAADLEAWLRAARDEIASLAGDVDARGHVIRDGQFEGGGAAGLEFVAADVVLVGSLDASRRALVVAGADVD